MNHWTDVIEEGEVLTEASMRGTFASYLSQAEKAFLKVAVKEIKKIAGGYAESVTVKQGRPGGVVWLEYKGQDRSDIDLEFTASLMLTQPTELTVQWDARSATRGKQDGYSKHSIGQATPGIIVQAWKAQFGH